MAVKRVACLQGGTVRVRARSKYGLRCGILLSCRPADACFEGDHVGLVGWAAQKRGGAFRRWRLRGMERVTALA